MTGTEVTIKTSDIRNFAFLACIKVIKAQSDRRESPELSSPRKRQVPGGIPDIVNSTELRSIVDAAELVEVPDGSGVWRLSRSAEEEALSWCR